MYSNKGFLLLDTMAVLLLVVMLCSVLLKMYGSCLIWMQKNKTLADSCAYMQQYRYTADETALPIGLQVTEHVREADGLIIKEVQLEANGKVILNLFWAEDE